MQRKHTCSYRIMNVCCIPLQSIFCVLIVTCLCCIPYIAKAVDYEFTFDKSSEYWPIENWRESTPENQGIHSENLASLLEEINSNNAASSPHDKEPLPRILP